MDSVKRYLVIALFTVFVLGNLASTAMAYCGADHNGSLEVGALSVATHNQVVVTDNYNDGTDADKVVKHRTAAEEKSHSSSCFNCYGSLCHSQSIVTYHFALGVYSSKVALHIDQAINQKYIVLATIPQPPKQLS